jgi:G3E family GTPase
VGVEARIPVTVLTGFLGAGKTTLLNRLLSSPTSPPIAVIVNEFGEVGIDGSLVVGAADRVVELRNGCVCCEVREDLRETALDLHRRRTRWLRPLRFERIVVETSGLATPGPVVQTFLLDPVLAGATRVDGVVALAHAGRVVQQLDLHPEVAAQLACADRIVLNHRDQVDADGLAAADAAVRAVAPLATVQVASRAAVPVAPLLEIGGADPATWQLPSVVSHSAGIDTVSLRGGEVDLPALKMFLQFVATRRGAEVLRLKGVFRCRGHHNAVVAQGVYQWLELGAGAMPAPEQSVAVVIGRGLDSEAIQRGWAAITRG